MELGKLTELVTSIRIGALKHGSLSVLPREVKCRDMAMGFFSLIVALYSQIAGKPGRESQSRVWKGKHGRSAVELPHVAAKKKLKQIVAEHDDQSTLRDKVRPLYFAWAIKHAFIIISYLVLQSCLHVQ